MEDPIPVVDASLLLEASAGEPGRARQASRVLAALLVFGESLHAPYLVEFEVASGLTRMVRDGRLSFEQASTVASDLGRLPLVLHDLGADILRAVEIALLLRRASAYDASYVALAERLGMPLITLDTALQRNAVSLGVDVRAVP